MEKAARRSKFNMTEGTEWKLILSFAIPIILGNMLQQLYNTVDGIVVGNYVNSNALAAIGTCSTLARFFLCFSMGFSNGCGVIVSQLYGARHEAEIKKAFTTGMIISLGLGVALSAFGLICHKWILATLMNISDPDVFGYADTYFVIYCMGLIFTYIYNFIAYVLRAFGDSRATLYFLALTSILNLVLDLLMVRWWGIAGAAVATVISQLVCAIVSYIYMSRRYETLNICLNEYRVDGSMAKKCVSLGIPAILQIVRWKASTAPTPRRGALRQTSSRTCAALSGRNTASWKPWPRATSAARGSCRTKSAGPISRIWRRPSTATSGSSRARRLT